MDSWNFVKQDSGIVSGYQGAVFSLVLQNKVTISAISSEAVQTVTASIFLSAAMRPWVIY